MSVPTDKPRFRNEIQGLRGTAALLIAVYHIWFNKVSGGVDVFFVVSGFLILGSLARESEATGSIRFVAFYTRIARRILPLAYVVVASATAGTVVFVSRLYWDDVFAGIRAAVFYVANFHFASTSVEYLAQDSNTSPVQHFWAMAIQAQFYLVAPLFVAAAMVTAVRLRLDRRKVLAIAVIAATVASFVYSVMTTGKDPAPMYFNSFARIWEFGVGGIVAILLAHVVVPARTGAVIAWTGLGVVFLNALVVGRLDYPGYVALVPVSGAVMLLLAGQSTEASWPVALLGSRPLVKLGDYSYGFFLWHWPLLIFGKLHYGVDDVSLLGGVAIIVGASVLAAVTHRLVESPFLRMRASDRARPLRTEIVALTLTVAALPMVTIGAQRSLRTDSANHSIVASVEMPDVERVPTASESRLFDPFTALRPDPLVADDDRGQTSIDGCFKKNNATSEVEICSYGDPTGPTVALVGGSHSLHWSPALKLVAEKHHWNLEIAVKVTCRYAEIKDSPCGRWVGNVEKHLLSTTPDVVVLTATSASSRNERVPDGYEDRWSALADAGIPVLAIRDNPWFPYSVPACIDENRADPSGCAYPRNELLRDVNPALESIASMPSMTAVDFNDYLCDATLCHGVIDNIVTYRDRDHLTATFVERLAPVVEEAMLEVLESNAVTGSSAEAG